MPNALTSADPTRSGTRRVSTLTPDGLLLATGPGTGPTGPVADPWFFEGSVRHPAVAARGLLAVAAVARTRCGTPRTRTFHDPVVTADGTALRFESFSACGGVHARLDLLPDGLDAGLDGPTAQRGTTNVDVNDPLRRALALVGDGDRMRFAVGPQELRVTTDDASIVEPKVTLPARWVRGFAEAAISLAGMDLRAELAPAEARRFLRDLPRGTGQDVRWLEPAGRGLRVTTRPGAGAVCLAGPRRLETLEPLLRWASAVRVHSAPVTGRATASAWEVDLPGARYTLVLSPEPSRGFSGEGGVLEALADGGEDADGDAQRVLDLLSWAPGLPAEDVADALGLTGARVRAALVRLGTSGRVGYDLAASAWFHRELPYDSGRAEADNPRLRAARALLAEGAVSDPVDGVVVVHRPDGDRHVRRTADGFSCTCPWWTAYAGSRGPCKHVLAVQVRDRAAVAADRAVQA
ncbi:SWIM zinc finger family protein [Kineococcus rhizosphaerae]|uniref:SWIM zinc finger protein n=1 Tax=Kineococcus rhizosphaerae TaxID=559628 RepID=A0A2T0R4N9_9ACTN|nr:SWIM zinc finger family protein [Kineococcus rhizosphaerae]PRY15326.1 SWIM zinc finger protein [Kineococcus rhizosphaerae]